MQDRRGVNSHMKKTWRSIATVAKAKKAHSKVVLGESDGPGVNARAKKRMSESETERTVSQGG
jgi:hypothetical protein